MSPRLGGYTVLLTFALALWGCRGATPTPAVVVGDSRPLPTLYARDTSHDFGEVDFARPYSHSFTVANTGTGPLHLTLARKSCHRAEIEAPPGDIAPGAKGQVTL